MTRAALAAAVTAMTVIAGPLADAQIVTTTTDFALPSGRLRSSQLLGSPVYDLEAREIGVIKEIVLGRDERVAAVVIDVGEFLGQRGKLIGVPLSDIKTYRGRLLLDRTTRQLQSASPYRL